MMSIPSHEIERQKCNIVCSTIKETNKIRDVCIKCCNEDGK